MILKNIVRIVVAAFTVFVFSVTGYTAEICTEHDYQYFSVEATCTESGLFGYRCSKCLIYKNLQSIAPLGHDFDEWNAVLEVSCSAAGTEQRVCCRCSFTENRTIDKLAHQYSTTVVAPTCSTVGYSLHTCQICGHEEKTNTVPKIEHTYSVWIQSPTCKRDGYTLHTCTFCGHEEKTDRVKAIGHQHESTVVAPTCTANGYTRYQCANCDDAYRTDQKEKTGHHYDNGVITKEPTLTTMGRITFTCQGCGITRTETTPKLFVDVDKGQYYYDSVLWAVGMGITTGMDDTHFSPGTICTRGQVVTFLWREAGKPAPQNRACSFVDVKLGAYYYEAVLWAVEQGVTNGVDATHFMPDQCCTRCQVVTFLYRAKGMQKADSTARFTDVKRTDYFYDSVNWAYGNGITTGITAKSFSPHSACTRAQIVTFIYRARNR